MYKLNRVDVKIWYVRELVPEGCLPCTKLLFCHDLALFVQIDRVGYAVRQFSSRHSLLLVQKLVLFGSHDDDRNVGCVRRKYLEYFYLRCLYCSICIGVYTDPDVVSDGSRQECNQPTK